jgi:hypothetical protein
MPNRLQWWRDRLTQDYALIGACIVAVLLAALICFLWIAPDLAMYFATGLIRLPPGSRSSTAHVFARVVSEIGQAATTSPGRNEDRDRTPTRQDWESVARSRHLPRRAAPSNAS